MGTFPEIDDLFSKADVVRTTHLLLHRTVMPDAVTYKFISTPAGKLLLGQAADGLCWSAFCDDENKALEEMTGVFREAVITPGGGLWLRKAENIMADPVRARDSLCLLVSGSQFRLGVWRQLLDTPFGTVTTYGRIAAGLGDPNASRAVGAAVGANPIAYFIPCHRVVNADGTTGHFRWGAETKKTLIAFEREAAAKKSGPFDSF